MSDHGRGTMVFVASISGICSAPFHAAYARGQSGADVLDPRAAAIELRPADVRVNAVAPGVIAAPSAGAVTRSRRATNWPTDALDSMERSRDMASTVLFLASDLAHYVSGQTLVVDDSLLSQVTARAYPLHQSRWERPWATRRASPTQGLASTKGGAHQ